MRPSLASRRVTLMLLAMTVAACSKPAPTGPVPPYPDLAAGPVTTVPGNKVGPSVAPGAGMPAEPGEASLPSSQAPATFPVLDSPGANPADVEGFTLADLAPGPQAPGGYWPPQGPFGPESFDPQVPPGLNPAALPGSTNLFPGDGDINQAMLDPRLLNLLPGQIPDSLAGDLLSRIDPLQVSGAFMPDEYRGLPGTYAGFAPGFSAGLFSRARFMYAGGAYIPFILRGHGFVPLGFVCRRTGLYIYPALILSGGILVPIFLAVPTLYDPFSALYPVMAPEVFVSPLDLAIVPEPFIHQPIVIREIVVLDEVDVYSRYRAIERINPRVRLPHRQIEAVRKGSKYRQRIDREALRLREASSDRDIADNDLIARVEATERSRARVARRADRDRQETERVIQEARAEVASRQPTENRRRLRDNNQRRESASRAEVARLRAEQDVRERNDAQAQREKQEALALTRRAAEADARDREAARAGERSRLADLERSKRDAEDQARNARAKRDAEDQARNARAKRDAEDQARNARAKRDAEDQARNARAKQASEDQARNARAKQAAEDQARNARAKQAAQDQDRNARAKQAAQAKAVEQDRRRNEVQERNRAETQARLAMDAKAKAKAKEEAQLRSEREEARKKRIPPRRIR